MAAFIQKLFGNRKATATAVTARKEATKEEADRTTRQDDQRELQAKALKANPTEGELEELAIGGLTAGIRSEAAEALTEKTTLQRVQKLAKGKDKGVYQIVRQKLQRIRDDEDRQRKLAETIQTIVRHAVEQARSDDTKLFEARLDALLQKWADVEAQASQQQTTEFLQAVHKCRERLREMQAEKDQLRHQQEQKSQRAETLSLLEDTLDELKHQDPDLEPSLASLDALQKTQENRWLEATRDAQVEKQEQKTYENLMQSLRSYISAVKRLGQHRDEIAALQATDSSDTDDSKLTDQASAILESVDWPRDFRRPTVLDALNRIAGKPRPAKTDKPDSEEQKAMAYSLRQVLDKLEEALDAKQLKESRQHFKAAQQLAKGLDHRHGKSLQPRMHLLGGQLRELTDWQGFATRPKQESLCEQMEYLANQPMEPEAKAERIKELQNEWRGLGGSSDRDLWSRFKQASDQAYEPCKAYFSAKSGLKQANLETRKAICDQLGTFLDNADWSSIDWKAAERIHQTAREEWKAAWPVEFRDNRPAQKRFDDLLKQLEAPLDTERKKNEALKQSIVERAEALIEHEPLGDAMNQAKALQTEWTSIGITRHREDRKLWQAFRKACDQIFARRDARRDEQEQLSREADEKAGPILDACQSASADSSLDGLKATLSELDSLRNEPLSADSRDRVGQERSRLSGLVSTRQLQEQIDTWKSWINSRSSSALDSELLPQHWAGLAAEVGQPDPVELVIRAEILAEVPSPAEDQGRRMEIQVQRLAEGMGNASSGSDKSRQLEMLVANWCLVQPVDVVSEPLAERLGKALEAVLRES
jgi:DNA repair protein SbcC/Rad50